MNYSLPSPDAPAAAAESPAATPAFSPLYQQIKGLILQSLQASEWKPGESIPSEMELAARYRVSQGDLNTEGPAQREIIDCKRLRASAEIARALALRSGDTVLQVRRVLSFANVPTILEDLWLPGTPFKGLTAERLADYHGPMYALFETEFGVRMVRAQEKIRAVLPDKAQRELLQLPSNTPLLSVERIAYTYNDTPMELRRGFYRTDTHHYHNDLN